MKKRFFSLLLAVAMVISIAPIALAEDTNANGNFVEMTVEEPRLHIVTDRIFCCLYSGGYGRGQTAR